jgi:hypothetical protein
MNMASEPLRELGSFSMHRMYGRTVQCHPVRRPKGEILSWLSIGESF